MSVPLTNYFLSHFGPCTQYSSGWILFLPLLPFLAPSPLSRLTFVTSWLRFSTTIQSMPPFPLFSSIALCFFHSSYQAVFKIVYLLFLNSLSPLLGCKLMKAQPVSVLWVFIGGWEEVLPSSIQHPALCLTLCLGYSRHSNIFIM